MNTKTKPIFYLIIFFLILYGCKKELYDSKITTEESKDALISTFESDFYAKGYGKKLERKLNDSLTLTYDIDWSSMSQKKLGDTLNYYYLPLNPKAYNSKTHLAIATSELNTKFFLIIGKSANNTFYRLATYVFDSDKSNAVKAVGRNYNLTNFTGHVIYDNLDKGTNSQNFYVNGTKMLDPNLKRISTQSSLGTNSYFTECYDQYTCHYYGYCPFGGLVITVTSNIGTCNYPTAFLTDCIYDGSNPDTHFYGWFLSATDINTICNTTYYPDPGMPTQPDPSTPGVDDPNNTNPTQNPTNPKPCDGDPIKNPTLAAPKPSNINGARFGLTRSNGTQNHNGIDIYALPNTALYPIANGVVTDIRTSFTPGQYAYKSYGNYIVIETTLSSGEKVLTKYAHLNGVTSGLHVGSTVSINDQMGLTGKTGNAAGSNIVPHVHIETRVNGTLVDPEHYIKTKFNPDGTPIIKPC